MARASALEIPPGLPQKGELLDGRYLIEEPLGAGGMGVVVAAQHVDLGHSVAIKFLLTEGGGPEASERLLREARALGAIRSEHVARVLDVGRLPSGAPYMVMERLTGTDLGRLRRARGRLPPSDAVDAVLQACEALAEAHALGIVHRDLKPSNLFVIARPDRTLCIKVIDFGLSKSSAPRGAKRLTATGHVAGSPHYMAPEQMRSLKHVDHRADIWSLGVILYYVIAGRRPHEGDGVMSIWGSIAAGPPPPLASLCPGVPAGLAALIHRCLEPDADRRPQDLAELGRGLLPFASSRGALSVEYVIRALSK